MCRSAVYRQRLRAKGIVGSSFSKICFESVNLLTWSQNDGQKIVDKNISDHFNESDFIDADGETYALGSMTIPLLTFTLREARDYDTLFTQIQASNANDLSSSFNEGDNEIFAAAI